MRCRGFSDKIWRHDPHHNGIRHTDTLHDDTQHIDPQNKDTQHNNKKCDAQHNIMLNLNTFSHFC
jgi:hypothetical protein